MRASVTLLSTVPPTPITFHRKYAQGMHILYRVPDMNSVPVEVQIA